MATFKLNDKGLKSLQAVMQKRTAEVQRQIALGAYWYLLEFGYHASLASGPYGVNGPGWSDYYAANWNISVGEPIRKVIKPVRSELKAEREQFMAQLSAKREISLKNIPPGIPVFVTNCVYYGKWLNDGGFLANTFKKKSSPNRFMELCLAAAKNNADNVIRNVAKSGN